MSGDRNAEQEALHRARKLHRELSEPVDEHFKQSMDGLSRGLGERLAQRPAHDPGAAAEKRRAALAEYDLERQRRVKSIFVMAGGGALSGCIAWAVVMLASPFDDPPMPVAASAKRTVPVEVAAVAAPPPPPAAAPIQVVPAAPVPIAVPAQAAAPAVEPPPLTREEVREMQARLRGFGFNPGPADGTAGPMTLAAATRYREDRGLGQADTLDRDLLNDLRADPAPQVVVAQAAAPAPRSYRSPPPRQQAARGDGFDGLRTTMQGLENWFQSLGR